MTRAPVDHIQAPAFPARADWIGARPLRMHQLRGHPVLIEFWDFCRPNSVRTLPYLIGWDARYRDAGLRVIGIHSPGFPPSADPAAVRAAVTRLGISYPVLHDPQLELWRDYDNRGWPARYLFGPDNMLFDYHLGEGAYADTETAIQELLGVHGPLMDPVRPEDAPDALIAPQSDDVTGPYSGPYVAGEVWAVLEPDPAAPPGERVVSVVSVEGTSLTVDHPGAYRLRHHELSTAGELSLALGTGLTCHAVCFTPGLAA